MEKNNYVKPTMRVVELKRRTCLLAGSPDPQDPDIGYIPNMGNNELNKLA